MNNDLISRSELYAAIGKRIAERHGYYSLRDIKDAINNAPTVELDESVIQEVLNKRCMTAVANEYLVALHGTKPQGEWHIDKSGVRWCKFCGSSEVSAWANFCHNCGAKMVLSEKTQEV